MAQVLKAVHFNHSQNNFLELTCSSFLIRRTVAAFRHTVV
jgi:hypothetical protein